MWLNSLLRSVKPGPSRRLNARRNPATHQRWFVPRLEALEDRTLLSTLTVLNNFDSGAGSLRDTIKSADSGDTIVFAPTLSGQTIGLTSEGLTIDKNLDIEGPGAGLLAISGNDQHRVFKISEGLAVTIAGLTITHGRTESGLGGGGILNVGSSLTLAHDLLSYNVASNLVAQGGAVANAGGGTLYATATSFIGNQALAKPATNAGLGLGFGGAIANSNFYNSRPSTAVLDGCTFAENLARGGDGGVLPPGWFNVGEAAGGAIFNETSGTLTVRNTTFTGNQAIAGNGGSGGNFAGSYLVDAAFGGAIYHFGTALTIDRSTFTGNRAIGGSNAIPSTGGSGSLGIAGGGAVVSFFGATITNSVFDHNEAMGGSGNPGGATVLKASQGFGGAIAEWGGFGAPATLMASNLTITDNRAIGGAGAAGWNGGDALGGGIANIGGASLTILASAITKNQAIGGAAGAGASTGQGVGGGAYFESGGIACLDLFTRNRAKKNTASTSGNDLFGDFTIC